MLVDSAACVERIVRSWALGHGLNPTEVITVAHGRRTIETVGLVAPHLDLGAEVAALAASESTSTEGVLEVPGARELLENLPGERWAIVTSGIRAVATLRLRHTRLPLPDTLVCAEDVRRGKPDPEGYLAAAERLGFAPRACVVVEDAPAGLEAARAAGMRSIGVMGTYGAELLGLADYTIPKLSALRVAGTTTGSLELRLSTVMTRGDR